MSVMTHQCIWPIRPLASLLLHYDSGAGISCLSDGGSYATARGSTARLRGRVLGLGRCLLLLLLLLLLQLLAGQDGARPEDLGQVPGVGNDRACVRVRGPSTLPASCHALTS